MRILPRPGKVATAKFQALREFDVFGEGVDGYLASPFAVGAVAFDCHTAFLAFCFLLKKRW